MRVLAQFITHKYLAFLSLVVGAGFSLRFWHSTDLNTQAKACAYQNYNKQQITLTTPYLWVIN